MTCRKAVVYGWFAALSVILGTTSADAALKISSNSTQNVDCQSNICAATAKKAVLNVADLANMLATADVTVKPTALAQDIEVEAALTWTSANRLTLDSYRSIYFYKPISITGTGALTIATNDGGSGGDFQFLGKGHVKFWDVSSSLIINGNSYALAGSMHRLIKYATQRRPDPFIAVSRSLDAGRTTYVAAPIRQYQGNTIEGLGNTISNLTINTTGGASTGLIGTANATIRDIGIISANIVAASGACVGPLVGDADFGSVVLNAYATGVVSAGDNAAAGGLVGCGVEGSLGQSHAAVTVSAGAQSAVGGLLGDNTGECVGTSFCGSVDQSYATGSTAGGSGAWVGGLAGLNIGGVISNSFATGPVSGGTNAAVGGLIGVAEDNGNIVPQLHQVYSTGSVNGGTGSTAGGLIGQDAADSSITNAYWDLDTSGITDPSKGAGNIVNDPGIAGLTDAQLKSGLPQGFDRHIWRHSATVNNGYPYLRATPP